MMKNNNISRILFVLMICSAFLFAGCSSSSVKTPNPGLDEEKSNAAADETDEFEEDEELEEDAEDDKALDEDVEMIDGLEVVDGNPIGEYQADGITKFMVLKEYQPEKFMPDVYLEKDHPYIQEIEASLTELFIALYEVDYRTITADRHEPYLVGELRSDSSFTDTSREIADKVVTEFVDAEIRTVNFDPGMEVARIGSDVIYYVKESTETESPYGNKYLPQETMIVSVTSDVEKIDGEWKATHAIELVPKILGDE